MNHNGDTWCANLSGGIAIGAVQTVGPGSLEFRTLWTKYSPRINSLAVGEGHNLLGTVSQQRYGRTFSR